MAAMNLSQAAGSSSSSSSGGGGDSGSVGAGGGKDDRIEQQYQYHTSRPADGKQEATNTAGMPRDSIWAVEPVPEHEQLVVRVAPGLVALYLPRTRQATTLPSL